MVSQRMSRDMDGESGCHLTTCTCTVNIMDETSNLLSSSAGEATAEEDTESEQQHDDVRDLEKQLFHAGFGFFHVILLLISGLATAADAVEIFGVSFIVPIAESDLDLDSGKKGWLDAVIFIGELLSTCMNPMSVFDVHACTSHCGRSGLWVTYNLVARHTEWMDSLMPKKVVWNTSVQGSNEHDRGHPWYRM